MADEINAGQLSFDFTADLSDLHAAFADAKKGLNDLSSSMAKGTGAMSDLGQAGQVAGGILIAEVVKGAVEAAQAVGRFAFVVTKSAGEAVEALETVAGQTGLTIQQLQELQPVFARSGMSAQAMGGVFRILSRNMEQAKDPASQATKAFRELGINISGLETPTEVFTLIAERISKLPDGFQKTRLETELLGRSGTRLNGVLSQGAEGLRQSAAEARAMGNVLNTEANTALLNVNDSFDDLDVAQANLEKHLGVLFAPFIQGLNEARKLTIDFATNVIDQVIVATRTLHARFMGLWGFLKEVATLSVLEWGKIPEIWAKWNTQTEQQVAKIRELGVTAKESADSVGTINTKAQAAGDALVAAANKSSMALVQLGMGWAIVEKALTRYRLVQKGVIDAGDAEVTHWTALTGAMTAMAAAADKASAAAGTMSPVEFAQGNADRAIAGIVAQQVAEKKHLQSTLDGLANEQSAHQRNTNEWLTFQQKKDTASKDSYAKMAVLDAQLNTAIIAGVSEVDQATKKMRDQDQAAFVSMATSKVSILEAGFATAAQLQDAQLSAINARQKQELDAVGLTEAQKLAIVQKADAEKIALHRRTADAERVAVLSLANSELKILEAQLASTAQLRAARLSIVELDLARELGATALTESQKVAIIRKSEAEKMAIAAQYPTFMEKQLQSIVASNAFSISQITTTWTSGLANAIVTGTDFVKAAWQSTQIALVQGALNTGVQLVAEWALQALRRKGIMLATASTELTAFTGLEASKTAIATEAALARTAMEVFMAKAAGAAGVASVIAIGMASMGVMEGIVISIAGVFAAMGAGLAATIVGAPFAPAFEVAAGAVIVSGTVATVAGTEAIATAATAAGALALGPGFAHGGIVTGPTLGLMGEAGSPEAAIPLNDRGARFMQQTMGLSQGSGSSGGSTSQTIIVELNGSPIMRMVADGLPSMLRLKGLPV